MTKQNKKMASKSKLANKTRLKLAKRGKLKKHKPQCKKFSQSPKQQQEQPHSESDMDDEMIEQLTEMMSKKDLRYLQQQKNVLKRKRKPAIVDDDVNLEDKYETFKDAENAGTVRKKMCLPIKTAEGVVIREIEEDQIKTSASESESEAEETKPEEIITTASLFVTRQQKLQEKRLKIGALASSFLEEPEQRIKRLRTLLELMDEQDPEICITVSKLSMASLLEVFKDILPAYKFRHQQQENVKLKKTTAQLQGYEKGLLSSYQLYLQNLENILNKYLKQKKGDKDKVINDAEEKMGEFALRCLCQLLLSKPDFNYSLNIANVIVPYMDNKIPQVRDICLTAVKTLFKEDKRGEVSYQVVRRINQLVKAKRHNMHPEVIDSLLVLKIKDVDLDKLVRDEMENKNKMTHQEKLIKMSRSERKREKLRDRLDRELLETKAEENKQNKHKYMTEITKLVFTIYFRILKQFPRSQLMSSVLEGLAKFAHCINLDFFQDLVTVLHQLMESNKLGYRETLHCIQTVFTILSGHGEALNIDPMRFYSHLYKNMFFVSAASSTNADIPVVLDCLDCIIIKRKKRVSMQRVLAFTKRLCTLSLQLAHNGTIGCLGLTRHIMAAHSKADILLDTDVSLGNGIFLPELEEPEHCNASNTTLWELLALRRHYHPTVRKFATHLLNGMPSQGQESLSIDFTRKSNEELFHMYDGSLMNFNPSVPPPVNIISKNNVKRKILK